MIYTAEKKIRKQKSFLLILCERWGICQLLTNTVLHNLFTVKKYWWELSGSNCADDNYPMW